MIPNCNSHDMNKQWKYFYSIYWCKSLYLKMYYPEHQNKCVTGPSAGAAEAACGKYAQVSIKLRHPDRQIQLHKRPQIRNLFDV